MTVINIKKKIGRMFEEMGEDVGPIGYLWHSNTMVYCKLSIQRKSRSFK